jgi:hypothetical protein
MRKQFSILFLFFIIILAACQSKTPPSTQESPSPTMDISSPVAHNPTSTLPSESPDSGAPPGCSVVSQPDTSDSGVDSLFPPVSDTDWSFGPGEAKITLIEYSDFQ